MAKKKTMKEIQQQSWKDIQQLSKRELKEQINTLNAVANKRIKRLEMRDLESPAVREIESYFKLKQTDTKQGLQKQLSTLTHFLDTKTSTLTGAKEYTTLSNKLASLMNLPETHQGRIDTWEILEKYRAQNPNVVQTGSKEIYEKIATIVGEYGVIDPKTLEKIRQKKDEFKDDFEYFPNDYNDYEESIDIIW